MRRHTVAERINPEYADVIAALRRADAERREGRAENEMPPVRGFLLPVSSDGADVFIAD